jgi:signal transduction histidine kinase
LQKESNDKIHSTLFARMLHVQKARKLMNNIIKTLVNLFISPSFEDDENKTAIARALHVILMILLGMIIIAILMALSGSASITNRGFFIFSVIVGPGGLITLLVVLHKGYVQFVAWAFVAFQWFTTILQVISSNGLESPALGNFIVTVLLAGFLISRKGVVVFGSLSVLSIVGVWYLESKNLLPAPLVFSSASAKLVVILSGVAVATVLLYMVMRRLQKALEESQTYAKEVVSLNEQLHKQVAELERFTYTVSHDLRSPLVTIKGFLGMLKQDMQQRRPDKIDTDMDRIAGATDKMDELLSDLLELSRIGRIMNPPEEIDTIQLIQNALESVDARIRSRTASVNITTHLPPLYGDRIRLREVFENLIDNAIKYMGDQANPIIEIGTQKHNNKTVFFVKDNGMGIEKQYHAKIFGLFEKLDPIIEGTGIGLALVKRIIETHGGEIWVESEGLGKGSTFYFSMPDKNSQETSANV